MKQLIDNFNLKIIIDFCKLSKQKPQSLLNNKLLKNEIKKYYRFSFKNGELLPEEKEMLGKQSTKWIKDNYKKNDTIVAMFENKQFVHAFINRDSLFIDAAGTTEIIDEIINDFPVVFPDFQIFNDLDLFLKEF